MSRLEYGPDRRLKKKNEFRAVHQDGTFVRGKSMNLWAYRGPQIKFSQGKSRLGIVVSNKTCRNATSRNVWKRRLREIFRRNQTRFITGCALMVQTKLLPGGPGVRKNEIPEYNVLEKEFLALASKVKVLK